VLTFTALASVFSRVVEMPEGALALSPVGNDHRGGPLVRGLISIGDRSLSVHCAGSGSPMVMLLGGYGGGINDWSKVQPELARSARVCSYDRAGIGSSDAVAVTPLAARETSQDLHTLLVAMEIDEPVVLVGFSVGGLFARYHAAVYPEEVAGLVLIDPTPPAWPAMKLAGVSARTRSLLLESLSGLNESEPELLDMLRIGSEVYGAPAIEVPVVMVTSGIKSLNPGPYGDELNRVLRKLQQTEARDLEVIEEVAEGCTHNIPAKCPEEVNERVLRMLNGLNSDTQKDSEPSQLAFGNIALLRRMGPSKTMVRLIRLSAGRRLTLRNSRRRAVGPCYRWPPGSSAANRTGSKSCFRITRGESKR
jgi:pimeloyl-ACP methyl ester carboxylesterase